MTDPISSPARGQFPPIDKLHELWGGKTRSQDHLANAAPMLYERLRELVIVVEAHYALTSQRLLHTGPAREALFLCTPQHGTEEQEPTK